VGCLSGIGNCFLAISLFAGLVEIKEIEELFGRVSCYGYCVGVDGELGERLYGNVFISC